MKLGSRLAAVPVTAAVACAWVLVQLLGPAEWMALDAMSPWRHGGTALLVSGFTHVGWGHLVANVVVWCLYASRVERRTGWWCVLVAAVGQVAGVAAHLVTVRSVAEAPGVLVGGSFIAASMLGAYLVLGPRERGPVAVAVLLLVTEALLVPEQLAGGLTSHTGHLAAAGAGALAAAGLRASGRVRSTGGEPPPAASAGEPLPGT